MEWNSSPIYTNLTKIYSSFFFKDLITFNIASLAHQWIICSEWVPSEWESKQLIKTLHLFCPSVNVLWSKKLLVCNKQIHHWNIKILISNCCFCQKYMFSIHNIALSSVISYDSEEKNEHIKHCLQVKTVQNISKETFRLILMWDRGWIFLLKEAL